MVTSYHSVRWSLGGTPNSHRVEGGRDPVNPIYRHVWRRTRAGLGWAGRVYEHELFTICSSNCHQLSPAAGAEQLTRHRACIITRVPASSHLTPARVSCRHYYHTDCTCARVKLYLSEAQSTCGVHHHTRHRYHQSSVITLTLHITCHPRVYCRYLRPKELKTYNLIGAQRNVAEYKTRTFYCLLISLAPL